MSSKLAIGMPLDRADGKLKVTGRAKYSAEMPLPGLVHAVLVESTVSNGTIKSRRPIAHHAVAHVPLVRGAAPSAGSVQVDIKSSDILNKFTPETEFGAAVDAIGIGGLPTLFSTSNVQTMLSAGEQSMSYRLYTELNVQDWHWNPNGTWTDPVHQKGYFVGSSQFRAPIVHSYGYQLLHRGDTFDQGDNQDYSRITDGSNSTFWKSNPYLTSTYTKESDSLHPQWVILDLGDDENVDAIKIDWASPFAVKYTVQYWTGDDAMYDPTNGQWVTFPSGTVTTGSGGTVTLRLSPTPISAEYIRVVMTQSSNTSSGDGSDPRSSMGYAINEIGIGTLGSGGSFNDLVTHSADQNQTTVYVSSTDPFHMSTAQNPGAEQVGLDYILSGNLSQNLPAMVPVPMFYSTPENAVAEITYLSRRRYEITGIELGEEPDGQFAMPEDYGAMFIQWAKAIKQCDPSARLGGPVMSSFITDTWANTGGTTDWVTRFIAYLASHNALSLLSFISTEHYPFSEDTADLSMLTQEPGQVQALFDEMTSARVPAGIPLYVTEYNMDGGTSQAIVDLEGALWHAIFVGEYLNHGGVGSYYYQYLPVQLSTDGTVWSLIGMFTGNSNDQISSKTSQFFSSQLICQQWCIPGRLQHVLMPASSNITDGNGNTLVMPYVVHRPDGEYSILLVNADTSPHTVNVTFTDTANHYFTGTVTQAQFSAKDYKWVPNGANGLPKPDGPYEVSSVGSGSGTAYTLPAESITVLRGTIK